MRLSGAHARADLQSVEGGNLKSRRARHGRMLASRSTLLRAVSAMLAAFSGAPRCSSSMLLRAPMRGLAAAARRAPASGKASSPSDGKQFALRSPLQFWGLPVPEGELGVSASTATRDELLTYLRQMYQVRCAGGARGGVEAQGGGGGGDEGARERSRALVCRGVGDAARRNAMWIVAGDASCALLTALAPGAIKKPRRACQRRFGPTALTHADPAHGADV